MQFFIKGTAKTVIGLGITTTVGYGTLYYSFSIMSQEFQKEFLWSKYFIFGIFSIGILIGGLLAPIIGRLLDNHGARLVMTIGSLLCAIGLFGISFVNSKFEYIIAIIYLQVVSTLVLYEAAFVAFSQLAKSHARLPIIQITLIAGFSSTIFWPLINSLLCIVTWREVYQILSLFHIFVAFPLHFLVIKKDLNISSHDEKLDDKAKEFKLNAKQRKNSMLLLAVIFSLIAIPITVTQTHFMGVLCEFGIELDIAVILGALIGPSQVAARALELFYFSKKFTPIYTAFFATFVMFLGYMFFLCCYDNIYLAFLFIIFYGAGQGLSDIIRGSIPLYLFGRDGYGKRTGKLYLFQTFVVATVPFGFAYLLENIGAENSIIFLGSVSLIAFILLNYLKFVVIKNKG